MPQSQKTRKVKLPKNFGKIKGDDNFKIVQAWAWFSQKRGMFKTDFGVMYATEKEVLNGCCKDDIVIPVTIFYSLPQKIKKIMK